MRFRGRKHKRELEAAVTLGRGLRTKGGQEAAVFLEDAARRFPESPEFPLLLATLYLELRPNEVAAQVAKAAELGSTDPTVQVRAGHMFLNAGDVEAARACAARAEKSVDDNFVLMAGLEGLIGRIAARDGEYAVAEGKLRSALRREPEYDTYALYLARFLWARGRNEDALIVIDETLGRVREDDKDLLERLRQEITDEA